MISTRKNNLFLRSVFALVFILLAAFFLSGCSEVRIDTSSGDSLIQVDKTELSKEEGIYRLLEQKIAYEGEGSEDIWSKKIGSETMNDYVKEAVMEELTLYTASVVMADELGVFMTDEDKVSASKAAEEAFAKTAEKASGEKYPVTLDAARELYIKKAVYEKVYEQVTRDVSESITENSTKVILLDYVILPARDGEIARAIYDDLQNGVSFSDACAAVGVIPELNQVVYPKTMSSNFESIAFALTDGELSEIVENKDEIFIIRCLDDKLLEESAANYTKTLADARNEAFEDYYHSFAKEHRLNVNQNFWNQIKLSEL